MIPPEVKQAAKIPKLAKGGYVSRKPIILNGGCIIPSSQFTITNVIKENILPSITIQLSKDERAWIDDINKAFYERQVAAWHINKK